MFNEVFYECFVFFVCGKNLWTNVLEKQLKITFTPEIVSVNPNIIPIKRTYWFQ